MHDINRRFICKELYLFSPFPRVPHLLRESGPRRRASAAAWNLIRPATVLVERAQGQVEDLMRRSDIPVVLGYLLLFLPVVLWAAAH
jgi:hypothetical protein